MAFFAHGSTVGTNALITRRLPRTAVVATEGFRDVHEIRRGTKPDLWDAYSDVAPPYVRRRDRFEVPERIDYAGHVLHEFDEDAARAVARRIKERGYESVAITFINAYMNGEHEARMKAIMEEEAPGVFVCTSHEILPEVFEHERFSTTIINACLAPVVSRYLANLTDQPARGRVQRRRPRPPLRWRRHDRRGDLAQRRPHRRLRPGSGGHGRRLLRPPVRLRQCHQPRHGRHQRRHLA